MPPSSAQRTLKRQQRLDWLRAYPSLAQLPGAHENVEGESSAALDQALRDMRLVQLYAPSLGSDAGRWNIRLLVSELRGQPTPGLDPRFKR